MQWFQHDSDAAESEKLSKVLELHGLVGYGLYFLIVEKIAAAFDAKNPRTFLTHSDKEWARKCRVSAGKFTKLCRSFAEIRSSRDQSPLILFELHEENGVKNITVDIPKLLERSDAYTLRVLRMSGQCTDSVRRVSCNTTLHDTTLHDTTDTRRRVSEIPPEEIRSFVEVYHQACPSLPRVEKLTEARKRSIRTRLKEQDLSWWTEFFKRVERSNFLAGRTRSRDPDRAPFLGSFDWILKPSNLVKIIEGNYDNRNGQGGGDFDDTDYGDGGPTTV